MEFSQRRRHSCRESPWSLSGVTLSVATELLFETYRKHTLSLKLLSGLLLMKQSFLFPYLGNHLWVLCIIHQLCIYQTQINYLQSLFLCSRICQSKSQHNADLYTVLLNLCGFGCSLCPKVTAKVIMNATRNKFLISFYIYTFWRWLSPSGSSPSLWHAHGVLQFSAHFFPVRPAKLRCTVHFIRVH